jgi:hypothetical protein
MRIVSVPLLAIYIEGDPFATFDLATLPSLKRRSNVADFHHEDGVPLEPFAAFAGPRSAMSLTSPLLMSGGSERDWSPTIRQGMALAGHSSITSRVPLMLVCS